MTESMFFMLYHIAQMLALGFDWGSEETLLQEKSSTGHRWDSNPGHNHCCKFIVFPVVSKQNNTGKTTLINKYTANYLYNTI